LEERFMTQVHVSDAKDMAESVAAHAADYAGTVTGEVKSLAGDVAHEVAQRVRSGLDAHDPGKALKAKAKKIKTPKTKKRQAEAKRSTATRRLAWGVALAAAVGFAVIAVRRTRRASAPQSPPVTNMGPEIGTDSDIPGPAYDPAVATS
jgi:hypothetical protein